MGEPEQTGDEPGTNPAVSTSLGSRLVNVYVSPAEVFDEIKASPPNAANWWVPLALVISTWIVYWMIVFSQPGIIQGMREVQEKNMQAQVDAGKITRQQADQAEEVIDKVMGPTFMKVMGILRALLVSPAALFFTALIVWLVGVKVFHGAFSYMRAVEAAGLASMISIVEVIVRLLLVVIYVNPSITPSPALLVSHFDQTNKLHIFLALLDLGSLWYVGVMAVGLSRLSGASFLKSALWGYGIWAIMTGVIFGFVVVAMMFGHK